MKHFVTVLIVILCWTNTAAAEKVILDSDMVNGFDDGFAMLMLGTASEIELLGVTIVAGNTWVETGTACAIRQLELAKLDIPVAMGVNEGTRPHRALQYPAEQSLYGISMDGWTGALLQPRFLNWQQAYRDMFKINPTLQPINQHAVDFIIDTVRKYPGEVTIAAIGPAGNLAMAIRKAPDIVPLIKRVVMMGGAYFKPGNITPAAEFNFWFDPEAARILLSVPFKEFMLVGLDVCDKIAFSKENYVKLKQTLGQSNFGNFFKLTQVYDVFENQGLTSFGIWDMLVAVAIINPQVITASNDYQIDINANFGHSYGQSLAYRKGAGPEGAQTASIATNVDTKLFWSMMDTFFEKLAKK